MSKPIIEVKNLSKRYTIGERAPYGSLREEIMQTITAPFKRRPQAAPDNTIWALKDVSFEVNEGEVLGIIGRNGAGKSTLLKILSRITEPTEGRVEFRGRVASLLEVGTGFHPELTGRENILLNGALMGMTRQEIKRKFDEIVDFSGIEMFIDTPVKRYSSGMYVRLAFAVAAHLEPEILFIDEVLAVGDEGFQKKCLGKMGDVARGGRTVLFVSHNMSAVRGLCERVMWINNGLIEAAGDGRYINSVSSGLPQNMLHKFKDMVVEKVVIKNTQGDETTSFPSGSDMVVEVHYNALKRIPSPYFNISILSQYGHLCGANMSLDKLTPDYIEGKGVIACVFKSLKLMPQVYTINLSATHQDRGTYLIPPIAHVAVFNVVGSAKELGMPEISDALLEMASPLIVAYEWHLQDGSVAVPQWSKGETTS
ncbi:MAG: ABC transporter ATP-binding protein [Planctomycetota bacterium]|jgi:lipopolysaccharide transport system ATP-binding protein